MATVFALFAADDFVAFAGDFTLFAEVVAAFVGVFAAFAADDFFAVGESALFSTADVFALGFFVVLAAPVDGFLTRTIVDWVDRLFIHVLSHDHGAGASTHPRTQEAFARLRSRRSC